VWHFLRTFNLPYCSLYERGFTSLGKRSLTLPNPALRRKQLQLPGDSPAEDTYWPAYMVSDLCCRSSLLHVCPSDRWFTRSCNCAAVVGLAAGAGGASVRTGGS
jgi:3'-phosphoadenosine 5'-phosphosulfate sulfotransferase (PAPS reductase)/FAD synthetase